MNTHPLSILPQNNILDMHQYQLGKLLQFDNDEKILFYHSLNSLLQFNQTNFVLLTNKYFYKFQDSLKIKINLSEVNSVKYQSNGFFKWDFLIFTMYDESTRTCGIYLSTAAEFFNEYINYYVEQLRIEHPEIIFQEEENNEQYFTSDSE